MNEELILESLSVTKNFFGDKSSGVNNITIQIPKGKITAIVGESGSGKTTLLKLLGGIMKQDDGEILFHGKPLPLRVVGAVDPLPTITMVSQDHYEMDNKATVWDNVARALPPEDKFYHIQKTTQALNLMGINDLRDQLFEKLSGGEKQRVTIAKALINRPEILMLDEPFNQVDATHRDSLQQDIRQIVKEWGVTVVLVSHNPAEILSMADQLVVLKEGEIVESGTPESLYDAPNLLYTAKSLSVCSELTADEAKYCGITSKRGTVVIYAEHVKPAPMNVGNKWKVKQVMFKGFYEELLIERFNVTLRMLNFQRGKYPIGERVSVVIKKYYEFGRWLNKY
jgi:ABC-type Fe3+/spermidine/putrescine transport system ATPase subunit